VPSLARHALPQTAARVPDLAVRVQIFATDAFVLPLPPGHRFPMDKYARLRVRVEAAGLGALQVPPAATREQLALAHDLDYVDRVQAGALTAKEQREIGFPWSPAMVERSLRSTGATIAACRAALADGLAVNLAGGTHHAFRGRGEGYCVFNDSAVAARVMQAEGLVRRVVVIDCDVHQGNGTAAAFRADPSVFTFSIHGARNFPFRKERSSLDVELPDGAGDDVFLAALEMHVPQILDDVRPELAVYLAGADPWREDRFGRLGMSKEGLMERDRLVLGACRDACVPVAVAMAGGYARDTEDTVDIHLNTIRTAAELRRKGRARETVRG
jgi:acetoin utilization deacetylase AcuC-like enzyme